MEHAKQKLLIIDAGTESNNQQNAARFSEPNPAITPGGRNADDPTQFKPKLANRTGPDDREEIAKAAIINKLNFYNFQDKSLLVTFKHRMYGQTLTLRAKPEPCFGNELTCRWSQSDNIQHIISRYELKNLLLANGYKLILIEPELTRIDNTGVTVQLPEKGYQFSARRVKRHPCHEVSAQVIQNGTLFCGEVIDFSAYSFCVQIHLKPPQTFEWINPHSFVNLLLSKDGETLYTGECRIIRYCGDQQKRSYIFKPQRDEIQRFKHKEFRSNRYDLTPAPNVYFRHPFTQKAFDLKVIDLSGSGFAVEEDENNSVLLPGMIIPKLELNFASSLKFACRAQVVYRKLIDEGKKGKWIKCGLAILDMDVQDHVHYLAFIQQARERNSYICNRVDLDDLWDFFFETGFIYPKKYAFIQKNKLTIKETYKKLYTHNPHIARHFIYQDKGRILGHMAMIRFYNNSWLIHHHAARRSALNQAGLVVLDQIGRMINNSHRLYSLHMNYMMCYYRPDNKFPHLVFGGATDNIDDPAGCSIDSFAYFYHPSKAQPCVLPASWEITAVYPADFQELESFYTHASGGLLLEAADLKAENSDLTTLAAEYRGLDLMRDRHLLALKNDGKLKAVLAVNTANLGLNLSDLTSSLKILVIDSDALTAEILQTAISVIGQQFRRDELPVLLYPVSYADSQGIAYDKIYNMWIFNLQYLDPYFKYINRLLRLSRSVK